MRISLTMIVQNEEANLPACLEPVASLVDEIVVVDTGSTDRTKELAARYGAQVHDFAWCDDFAAARNESLRHATGDWVFWLDADDRVDAGNRDRLRPLFAGLPDEPAVYVMTCVSAHEAGGQCQTSAIDHARLFPRHPALRWHYRVHEQIRSTDADWPVVERFTDIVIHHAGYEIPEANRRKLERNRRLGHRDMDEHPGDPVPAFYLGWTYMALERPADALPILRHCLEQTSGPARYLPKLYSLLVQGLAQVGQLSEAMALCAEGQARFPDDAQLLAQESSLRWNLGDLPGCEACLVRLLRLPATAPAFTGSLDLRRQARHNLILLYRQQGRLAEADELEKQGRQLPIEAREP